MFRFFGGERSAGIVSIGKKLNSTITQYLLRKEHETLFFVSRRFQNGKIRHIFFYIYLVAARTADCVISHGKV